MGGTGGSLDGGASIVSGLTDNRNDFEVEDSVEQKPLRQTPPLRKDQQQSPSPSKKLHLPPVLGPPIKAGNHRVLGPPVISQGMSIGGLVRGELGGRRVAGPPLKPIGGAPLSSHRSLAVADVNESNVDGDKDTTLAAHP